MKLPYVSVPLLFFLLGVLSPSGAVFEEDLNNLYHKMTNADFDSRTLHEINETLELDQNIQPSLEDLAKLYTQVKNISQSLKWLDKYKLNDYFFMDSDPDKGFELFCKKARDILQKITAEIFTRLWVINKYCLNDLMSFIARLPEGPANWPMKLLDASGKPFSGIFKGAVHWVGDFEQCTSISSPRGPENISETNPLIHGQYCTMHIAIPENMKKILIPTDLHADFANIVETLEIKWDFCITQHCKHSEIKHLFSPIFDFVNETFQIEVTDVTCLEPVHVFDDKIAIVNLSLIGIVCVFLFIGTIYDLILCCCKGSDFDYNEESIADINFNNTYENSHYNNAFEMDTTSFDSSMNSMSKSRDGDDTEDEVAACSAGSNPVVQNYDNFSLRKSAPVAPVQSTGPTPSETLAHRLSKREAPAPPPTPPAAPIPPAPAIPPSGTLTHQLSKREAPAPPPPPPLSEYPPEASNSIMYSNTNQNANTFDINGHLPNTDSKAEYDIFKQKTTYDRGFGSFLLAFSVRRNAYWLLNTEHPVEMLSCLNGIRFLSMAWIILGHTYKIAQEDYIKNLIDGIPLHESFAFQSVLAAPYAVDTFFLLSGILITYFFLENYYSKGNVSLKTMLLIYLRRFLRLTPCYAVVLMFYTCLLPNLAEGPYWKHDLSKTCRKSWWANLLYINNFFKMKDECMSWTWYLANDMQFFVISPMILCQFILVPSFAIFTTILLFTAYIISSVVLWQKVLDPTQNDFSYDDIYTKPWCRISPFLIGMMLGYFLQQKNRKRSFPKFFQLIGWIFATGISLFICYIKYTLNRKDNPATWLHSQHIAYEVTSHPLWAMAVSWVIIICASGNGGIISDILSWRFWIILSRLTYGAYLIHPIVISVAMRLSMTPFYLSIPTTIYAFIGHLTVSYGISFIISLLFEMPVRMIEKVISNRK